MSFFRLLPFLFFALPQLAFAFSFDLTSVPTQCGQLNVNITQGSGTPPYSILVVPFGASPVTPERRNILTHSFNGPSTSFQMAYPANSGFVIAVGDANGIATGGTSIPTKVVSSNDTSCLPSSASFEFSFQILPTTTINQCQQVTLAWVEQAQEDVAFQLIIPGGQSSTIPQTNLQQGLQGNTTGFNWVPNIPVGTNIILVASDSGGIGTGGSAGFSVGNNPNGDNSCINGNSPSSTPGTAAGAISTGDSSPAPNNNNGNGNNKSGSSTSTGAIVGGVVAGITAIIIAVLVTLFCVRRMRHNQQRRRRQSLDLLPDIGQGQAMEMYHPEPLITPFTATTNTNSSRHARTASELSEGSDDESRGRSRSGGGGMSVGGLRASTASDADGRWYSAVSTTEGSETRRGKTMPPVFRSVNYVQHEDAGQLAARSGDNEDSVEPETVELPPNYDSISTKR